MMRTDVLEVQGWARQFESLCGRIGGCFGRRDPRRLLLAIAWPGMTRTDGPGRLTALAACLLPQAASGKSSLQRNGPSKRRCLQAQRYRSHCHEQGTCDLPIPITAR